VTGETAVPRGVAQAFFRQDAPRAASVRWG